MFVFKGTAAAEASKDQSLREWRVTDHYNIQELGKHPFHTMLQPSLHHRSLTEDARRPPLPQPRSRSSSSIALHTLYEKRRPSHTPSFDQSPVKNWADRRPSSSGSVHKRVGSSDNFGKTLMAKGSRLLRRQNSKHDLTSLETLEWLEDVKQETANRPASKPSPIRRGSDGQCCHRGVRSRAKLTIEQIPPLDTTSPSLSTSSTLRTLPHSRWKRFRKRIMAI